MDFDIHGLIKIRVEDGLPQLGETSRFFQTFKAEDLKKPDIVISKNRGMKAHNTFDEISFYKDFLVYFDRFGNQAFINLDAKPIEVFLDEKFVPSYFMVQPMTWLLRNLLNDKGGELIHGAAASKDKSGFLFPALPDTGKTTLSLELLRNGFNFMGDDKVILHNKNIFTLYPNLTLLYYNFKMNPYLYKKVFGIKDMPKQRVWFSSKIREWFNKHPTAIRFSDKFVFPAKTYPVDRVFPGAKVELEAPLKKVLFLTKEKPSKTGFEDFVNKVFNSNFFEFWCINKIDVIRSTVFGVDYLTELARRKKVVRENLKGVYFNELRLEKGKLTEEAKKELGIGAYGE